MARPLRRIAEDPDNFYTGSLAEDIASDLEEVGSWKKVRINSQSIWSLHTNLAQFCTRPYTRKV